METGKMFDEENQRATIPWIARLLVKTRGDLVAAAYLAERGALDVPSPVARILRSAVAGGSLADPTWAGLLAGAPGATQAFLGQVGGRSAFVGLIDAGVLSRAPLRSRVGVVITGALADIAVEGHARPVSRMTLTGDTLAPIEASALVVLSRELVEATDAASQTYLSRMLRKALAKALDVGFLEAIVSTSTPSFSSSGNDVDAMRADVRTMLASVSSGEGRMAWVAAPDVAAGAAALDTRGTVAPEGASEFYGLPHFVSAGLAPGMLVLLDGDRIGGDVESLGIDLGREAAIEMNDAPLGNSATPTARSLVSMFGTNSVAIRIAASFGAVAGAPDAVAVLDGIEWASPSS
ncbi:phage major capsid protein [Mesorhizobium sp. ASY16-5R]|uniref:phage major capsid protein n=1 Tax=Mesorhizobium sp. ASY16-5R TaxID=3445772 RepID=UPI003F9EF176